MTPSILRLQKVEDPPESGLLSQLGKVKVGSSVGPTQPQLSRCSVRPFLKLLNVLEASLVFQTCFFSVL